MNADDDAFEQSEKLVSITLSLSHSMRWRRLILLSPLRANLSFATRQTDLKEKSRFVMDEEKSHPEKAFKNLILCFTCYVKCHNMFVRQLYFFQHFARCLFRALKDALVYGDCKRIVNSMRGFS